MKPLKPLVLSVLTGLLPACVSNAPPKHIPYVVNDINQRAKIIAAQDRNLRSSVVKLALKAYNRAQMDGYGDSHHLTIIDYSLPSTTTRMWVIDLHTNRILFREKVAHGVGSGELYATKFSDQVNSRQSSIGMYLTAEDGYVGRHGYALRLQGLEPGFNQHAMERAIVLHSAPYISDEYIERHGYLGQSWGCPAINPKDLHRVVNTIKGRSLLFAYANVPNWLHQSRFLT
jgi:hypothetical protein